MNKKMETKSTYKSRNYKRNIKNKTKMWCAAKLALMGNSAVMSKFKKNL